MQGRETPVEIRIVRILFPQILQGPIGRYSRLADQLYAEHRFEGNNIIRGFERILWGFFKKMILADWAAAFADAIFEDPAKYTICVYLAGSSVINNDSACRRRETEMNAEFWEPACGRVITNEK